MATIRLARIPYRGFQKMVKLAIVLFCIGNLLVILKMPRGHTQIPERFERNFTIWSNDFHIGTIRDVKYQLVPFHINVLDNSLSYHCHLTKTCAKHLKVLNRQNGISPTTAERQRFYEAYKDDPEMNNVDAFLCFHPTAMCEVFMPFNRPIIIIAPARYEMGRFSKDEWIKWNNNLKTIALNPRNIVAANNLYDVEYVRYFTGVRPILLPSLCDYTGVTYTPKPQQSFLIAPFYKPAFRSQFINNITAAIRRSNSSVSVDYIRDRYKEHYEYSDIVSHRGMIYVPYQVSVMSLFEQYRMNIPLFFPSLELLTEWHYTHAVVDQRTWDMVNKTPHNASLIPGVLGPEVPDPNNEFDRDAIRYWLRFSDFYQWPHITYFDSADDLVSKLSSVDLDDISAKMKVYNTAVKKELIEQWKEILPRIGFK